MVTDVEIERSLNALSATLNDQRLDHMDLDRIQEIVTLALGGEPRLRAVDDPERTGRTAWLRDRKDHVVGRIDLEDGPHWTVRRHGPPRSGGSAPPASAG